MEIKDWKQGEVVKIDYKNDLALIKLLEDPRPIQTFSKDQQKSRSERPRRWLPVADDLNQLQVGAPVATLGHPLAVSLFGHSSLDPDYLYTFSTGVISKINEHNSTFLTDLVVNSGNSGGPVINEDGQIVGVTSRKIRQIGIMESGARLQEFLPDLKNAEQAHQDLPELAWWKTRPMSFDLGIGFSAIGFERSKESFDTYHLEATANLWHRLGVSYMFAVGGSDLDSWTAVKAYWQFVIPLGGTDLLRVHPGWSKHFYALEEETKGISRGSGDGPYLELAYGRLPYYLQFSVLQTNDGRTSTIGFLIRI